MNKPEFKRVILPLSDKLFRLARRLVHDAELAKDCVQEGIMKLWEKRNTLEAIESIQGFALTVVRNICLDALRKVKRFQDYASHPIQNITLNSYDYDEGRELIGRLVQLLPEQQRLVFQLRDLEELTNEEVAAALDISVNNVRANLSMARKRIREELIKLYDHGLGKS